MMELHLHHHASLAVELSGQVIAFLRKPGVSRQQHLRSINDQGPVVRQVVVAGSDRDFDLHYRVATRVRADPMDRLHLHLQHSR